MARVLMRAWGAFLLLLPLAIRAQDGAERLDSSSQASQPLQLAPVATPSAPPLSSIPQAHAVDTTLATMSAAPAHPAELPITDTAMDSTVRASRPGPVAPPPPSGLGFPAPPAVVIGIDTQARRSAGKSVWLAAGLSLALPGAGEEYMGAKGRARFFFTTELLYVAATYLTWRSREDALQSARELANRYAGAQADGKDASFLELMGQYRSRRITSPSRHDSYDEAMILAGESTTREIPETVDYDWDWGSSENPQNNSHLRSFESQMRIYRASKVAFNFSLGAMAVNRVLSLFDILWLHRSAWVQAEAAPTYQGAQARLSWRF